MNKSKIRILLGLFIFIGLLSLINIKVNAAENTDFYFVDNETLQQYASNDIQFSMSRAYGDTFIDWYGVQYVERNVLTPNSSLVVVYEAVEEASNYYLNIWNNSINYDYYPTVNNLSNATALYNCHSYAWYLMDSSNIYWMDEPNQYYDDASYYEVTTPRKGDKICYYDSTGYNLHSGVVVDTLPGESNNICGDSNLVTVVSKWGRLGLFEHRGDDCVYTGAHGGNATYVKYYRPRTSNTYTLSNYNSTINNSLIVDSSTQKIDAYELYELDVNYTKNYEFNINANNALDVRLYDEHMQLVDILDLNNNANYVHFIEQLYKNKTYYLRVAYDSEENTGTINTKIVSRTTAYINFGDNDVLLNTHNYNEGIYPNNYYYYINGKGVGFYRFTLTGIKVDGTEVTYPSSAIMIKNHMNEDIIDKYSLTEYSNQAISGYNENTFVAYLNTTGYFYVYVDIDTEGLNSLTLSIESVESETIDLFTKSESSNSTMEVLNSETTKGDYAKMIILKQAGKFTIDYSYNGSQSSDILFVLSKLNYNSTTQKYTIETLISQLMDGTNDAFTHTLNLTDGTYFVAYFNKDDNSAFDVTFNRIVTQYDSSLLYTDPDAYTDCGSMINIYEKGIVSYDRSYRSTTIVKGFTRVIYFNANQVNQVSRHDYYWYSSDESIADISIHGTVFGKSTGTVKIMAVNKDNPSIVFVKQFTVVRDTKTYTGVIYNEINDKHKLSSCKYQLGLIVQNSPYPMVQYYSWRVVSKSSTITSVSIDQWGNVTIVGTGNIVIEGYDYRYNENYGVRINLTVTN